MKKWKVLILVLIVILLAGIVGAGCYPKEKISEMEAQIVNQETQIADQEVQIAEQKGQIVDQETQLAEQKAKMTEQESQLVDLKDKVAEYKVQTAEREAQAAEREARIAAITTQISKLESQTTEQSAQMEGLEAVIAELEEEKAALEAENEFLKEPAPQLDAPWIAGTITFKETVELLREFFPRSSRMTSAYTRGPYQLVDLETLENFLAVDKTDTFPLYLERSYDVGDPLAFRLKEHWIEAGIPPWSLGLIKGERMTSFGKVWCWRNIFLTIENGEYVFYEVVPHTDEIIKIEEPYLEPHRVIISDRL